MTLEQIKAAVAAGKIVYWCNPNYQVIEDASGQYIIKCINKGYYIGLTWTDNKTLNGEESEFFVSKLGSGENDV